jgi:hypothetical protein
MAAPNYTIASQRDRSDPTVRFTVAGATTLSDGFAVIFRVSLSVTVRRMALLRTVHPVDCDARRGLSQRSRQFWRMLRSSQRVLLCAWWPGPRRLSDGTAVDEGRLIGQALALLKVADHNFQQLLPIARDLTLDRTHLLRRYQRLQNARASEHFRPRAVAVREIAFFADPAGIDPAARRRRERQCAI